MSNRSKLKRPTRYRKRSVGKRPAQPVLTSRFFWIDDSATHEQMRSRRREWK